MKTKSLDKKQLIQLKSLAHALKPVVIVGQHGMKDSIDEEIQTALNYHQLIKIKINLGDRQLRDELVKQLCQKHHAELIQRIGNIATLYRHNPKKDSLF